ncbi:MAG TPA: hypothetical protein VIG24_10650 [Acidimicrobiia bacterium]
MERDPLSETVLREEIALLREQESRLKQSLGRVAEERRRREAEWMAVRGEDLMRRRLEDDHE